MIVVGWWCPWPHFHSIGPDMHWSHLQCYAPHGHWAHLCTSIIYKTKDCFYCYGSIGLPASTCVQLLPRQWHGRDYCKYFWMWCSWIFNCCHCTNDLVNVPNCGRCDTQNIGWWIILAERNRRLPQGHLVPNTTLHCTGLPNLQLWDKLWYIGECLIIPHTGNLQETLFTLVHDTLGHFGFHKTYGSLQDSYYWPNMCHDLEQGYIKSCPDCQWNKSATTKLLSPLHPLPIPDQPGDSVAINFIGPLPEDKNKNCFITFTDCLGSDVQTIATRTNITAEQLATIFFDEWYCENGSPADIISNRDKLFMSRFWKALHCLTGVKLKMSMVYHPETDGASKHTNKTVNQVLRFHVERNQIGWVHALPWIRFNIMNTVNKSTSFTPFQLCMGRSPRVIPPCKIKRNSVWCGCLACNTPTGSGHPWGAG